MTVVPKSLVCRMALVAAMLCGHSCPLSSPQDHSSRATPVSPASGSPEDAGNHADVKQNPEIPPRPGAIAGATDSELQSQIQKTLRSEPTLRSDDLIVSVSASTVEISGNVANSRDRLTAMRIAHSYAGSKQVLNHVQVRESGKNALDRQPPDKAKHLANSN